MLTRIRTRKLGTTSAVAVALVSAVVALPAASADTGRLAWPNDTFDVCAAECAGWSEGGVVWGNRTSNVQGSVVDALGYGTVVHITAYAGSTKVQGTTRSAPAFGETPYNFAIGDPDLVGGIDRIKVQVCTTGATRCSTPANLDRDGVPEHVVVR